MDGSVFTSLASQTGIIFNIRSGPWGNSCPFLRQAVECVPCCTTLRWPLKFRTPSWMPSLNGHINKTPKRIEMRMLSETYNWHWQGHKTSILFLLFGLLNPEENESEKQEVCGITLVSWCLLPQRNKKKHGIWEEVVVE